MYVSLVGDIEEEFVIGAVKDAVQGGGEFHYAQVWAEVSTGFWEGVDVRGSALSLVIIDKLPFASPGDPVLQARIDQIRKSGQNAFFDFQLPNAVITLKQGVGRLIRDVSDKGVMVICDPRLTGKSYGKVFLKSLPPMRRVIDTEIVKTFLQQLD